MLAELQCKQHPGEPHRRWFHSPAQDLYLWQNDAGEITAFQLCYGKPCNEHAFYWREDKGYSHLRVDDGEGSGDSLAGNATPLLLADGYFPAAPTLASFQEEAGALPADIVEFISAKIRAYPTPAEQSP